jgi:hypothetical protein
VRAVSAAGLQRPICCTVNLHARRCEKRVLMPVMVSLLRGARRLQLSHACMRGGLPTRFMKAEPRAVQQPTTSRSIQTTSVDDSSQAAYRHGACAGDNYRSVHVGQMGEVPSLCLTLSPPPLSLLTASMSSTSRLGWSL